MAKINSISNATGYLTIDPGASGDSALQFSINATPEFIIGVDDTDDSFRISQGSALGTNDTWIMDANGIRRMPLQPCFNAYNSATDSNVTGDGTVVSPVDFDTEIFDQNSDFAADIFTAPVAGRYFFAFQVFFQNAEAFTGGYISLVTSNRSYVFNMGDPSVFSGGINSIVHSKTYVDMDAADTAYVTAMISGGAKTVEILGAASAYTFFHGALIC